MEHVFTRRRAGWADIALLLLGVLLSIVVFSGSTAARAETGKKALILDSTVSGGAGSIEAQEAAAAGFGPIDVVDDATWSAMTAAQFADYQLVIVGDPTCNYNLSPAVSANAANLADAVMARAGGNTKVGNRVLIGTDPVFHTQFTTPDARHLITGGINFAGVRDGATNLYLDLSCGDADWDGNGQPDAADKLLPKLTADPTPGWSENTAPPCGGSVSLISNADQFSVVHSSDLQGWFCSVHESFPTFPSDWIPLAVATDTPTTPTCGNDVDTGEGACGEAYVLIAGSGITATAPNLALDPTEATNPVGTTHTVTATVTNSDHNPISGAKVDWVVTGANNGATGTCVPAGCTTDANGHVSFTYTGANAGDDTIIASVDVEGARNTATAVKHWIAARLPKVSVDDASVTEGNTGYSPATPMTFHVTLDAPATAPVDVQLKTTDGTATSPADYQGGTVNVHFDAGDTSKPVVVNVDGDLIDEPNEQFTVDLQNATGAVIDDGHGVGTILDDDRNGRFVCSATSLRANSMSLPPNTGTANPAFDPCRADSHSLAALPPSLNLSGSVLAVATGQSPADLVHTKPLATDKATADASVATVKIIAGLHTISANALSAHAQATCPIPGGAPALSASGLTAQLLIDGKATNANQSVDIPLLGGFIVHINSTTTANGVITRRALWVSGPNLDVVVAEAVAGTVGNPCATRA